MNEINQPKKVESKFYYPNEDTVKNTNIKNWEEVNEFATNNFEEFWSKEANELHWFEKWNRFKDDDNPPFYKFFVGGKTNICYNALDRHLSTHRKNKLALIWEGEDGSSTAMSYFALHRDVSKFANVLKSMGVTKGDKVTIYMGRIPELIIAMLACARIGAVHSVVYGGFSIEALNDRIEDSQSRVVITCDGAYQRGKLVNLKDIVDEAVSRNGIVEHIICVQRTKQPIKLEAGRDY